jgi:hypothetical protein
LTKASVNLSLATLFPDDNLHVIFAVQMVDARYRVLRGDPARVAALIPAGQSC